MIQRLVMLLCVAAVAPALPCSAQVANDSTLLRRLETEHPCVPERMRIAYTFSPTLLPRARCTLAMTALDYIAAGGTTGLGILPRDTAAFYEAAVSDIHLDVLDVFGEDRSESYWSVRFGVRDKARALDVRIDRPTGRISAGLAQEVHWTRQGSREADTAVVLMMAFLDTRLLLPPGYAIEINPYWSLVTPYPSDANSQRLWAQQHLGLMLADTSVRLGDARALSMTVEGVPLWLPSGSVGVSFSGLEFRADTARLKVGVTTRLPRFSSAASYGVTLLLSEGRWSVVHRDGFVYRQLARRELSEILRVALLGARATMVPGRPIIVSPFHFPSSSLLQWSPDDLAGVLTAGDVRVAEIDRADCAGSEPLACVLEPAQTGVVFGRPRVTNDTAVVRMKVFGRLGDGHMLSISYYEHTLVRQSGQWGHLRRRWLGGT